MINQSSDAKATTDVEDGNEQGRLFPRKLLIIVTVTRTSCNGTLDVGLLTRLGNTLRLVTPPLLWIVVEGQRPEQEYDDTVYATLIKTRVIDKNLVMVENYTNESIPEIVDRHRRVTLWHIVKHRLSGIARFASAWDIYDLGFFEELRKSEMLGKWPVSSDRQKMDSAILLRLACDSSSKLVGWCARFQQPSTKLDARDVSTGDLHPCVGFNSTILFEHSGIFRFIGRNLGIAKRNRITP